MINYADYLTWLADGGWIRTSARAIIFNSTRQRILVERNDWMANDYFNFVGGGVEVNETLEECIARELGEVDLRPAIVRDAIVDGSYARVKHQVLRDDGGNDA